MQSRPSESAARSPTTVREASDGSVAAVRRPRAGTLGRLLSQYLSEQHDVLLGHDLRRGADARVAERTCSAVLRIEAEVQVFHPAFDTRQTDQLLGPLSWLGSLLADVTAQGALAERVQGRVTSLRDDLVLGPVAAHVARVLERDRARQCERLDEAVDSECHRQLLVLLRGWRAAPPLSGKAALPAAAADKYLSRALADFDRQLTRALPDQDPAQLRLARRAARQLVHAAEVGVGGLGRKVAKSVRRVQRLQSLLDDLDAGLRSADFFSRVGPVAAADQGHNGFTYGVLYEQELRQTTVLWQRLAEELR